MEKFHVEKSCPHCEKKVPGFFLLKSHIYSVHTKPKKIRKCNECQEIFYYASKINLNLIQNFIDIDLFIGCKFTKS